MGANAVAITKPAKGGGDLKRGLAAAGDDDDRTPARGGDHPLDHVPQRQQCGQRLDRPNPGQVFQGERVSDRAADIERDDVKIHSAAAHHARPALSEIDVFDSCRMVADAMGRSQRNDINFAGAKFERSRKRAGRKSRIGEGRGADQAEIKARVSERLRTADDIQVRMAGADQKNP